MAELLSKWAQAFEKSSFYTDFCAYLPGGLNNAYLDILILLTGSVLFLILMTCIVSAKRRQRMFERELLSLKAERQERSSQKEYEAFLRWKKNGGQAGTERRAEPCGSNSAKAADPGISGNATAKAPDKPKASEKVKASEKRPDTASGKEGMKKEGAASGGQEKTGQAQNGGRKRFDVNELIEKKRQEEANKEKGVKKDGVNKLEASIGQVKAERDLEARYRAMDEESKKRAEKNMTLLSKQFEKRLQTDTDQKQGGWR